MHLGCYQADEISINKTDLCNAEKTQTLHLKCHLDVFTLFNAALWNMEYFNLQLQINK